MMGSSDGTRGRLGSGGSGALGISGLEMRGDGVEMANGVYGIFTGLQKCQYSGMFSSLSGKPICFEEMSRNPAIYFFRSMRHTGIPPIPFFTY